MPKSRKPLSERQERFVQAYILTGNATEAARRAGYKVPNNHGPHLVKQGPIAQAIAAIQASTAKATILSKQEGEELLTSFVKDCKNPLKERRESLKLLGLMRGWHTTNNRITGANGGPIQTQDVSDLPADQLILLLRASGDDSK